MNWELKAFNDLTNMELHDIFKLRTDIFVVEQNCPYPEIDGKDPHSLHLMGKINDEIVAYTRILPPSTSFSEPSIGRVIVAKNQRGTGVGHELLKQSIAISLEKYQKSIKIGAQAHLEDYYGQHGFKKISDIYLEDDIPHIDMLLEI